MSLEQELEQRMRGVVNDIKRAAKIEVEAEIRQEVREEMRDLPELGEFLGGLERRGFIVSDMYWPADAFEMMVGKRGNLDMPAGVVRVMRDDNEIIIVVTNGNGVELWDARLTNVPASVVLSVVDQAIAYVASVMMGGYSE